jgi:hypothetical protein
VRVTILLLGIAGVFANTPAFGQPFVQSPPPLDRPYRGLFGGGVPETEHLLTLGLNMGGGFDSSVLADSGATLDPSLFTPGRRESGFGQASANLTYSMHRTTFDLSASGATAATYYRALESQFAYRHSGHVNAQYRMSESTTISGNYGVSYRPMRLLTTYPIVPPTVPGPSNPLDTVLGASRESYISVVGNADISHELARRLSLWAGFRTWNTLSSPDERNMSTLHGSAGVTYGLTRSLGLRVGYRYGRGRYYTVDLPPIVHTHNVDFGLDFRKALSLTRRTTMTFGTGTVGLTDGQTTSVTLAGHVHVAHEIGRTWGASAGYNRDARFVESFRQPVITNMFWSDLSGLINRRLHFGTNVGVTDGEVGMTGVNNNFTTVYASAGLGIGLTRNLSCGIRYSFERYRFDSAIDMPFDLRYQSMRHGVFANLSAWMPLLQRTRRP